MHIAFTSDFLDIENIGGAGRVLWEVARELDARGCRISFVVGDPRGARCETISAPRWEGRQPLTWSTFPYRTQGRRGLGFLWSTARRVRQAFRALEDQPDVVVHNQPLSGGALSGLPLPSVYLFHSPWPLEYVADRFGTETWRGARGVGSQLAVGVRRYLEKQAVTASQSVVTLSNYMSAQVRDLYSVPDSDVRVCPGGVDLDRFCPISDAERAGLRNARGIAPDERVLVCVRRLVSRTGVDLFLDALATAPLSEQKVRVLIAGRGPRQAEYQSRAQDNGLGDKVSFLGYVPDDQLADLYRVADLAVVPTRALEGFGLSTLEAMACGTPVVATPVGGTIEILEQFRPELLAASVDPQSLATSMAQQLSDPSSLAALRAASRSYVETQFSWGTMASQLIECLATLSDPIGV